MYRLHKSITLPAQSEADDMQHRTIFEFLSVLSEIKKAMLTNLHSFDFPAHVFVKVTVWLLYCANSGTRV